MPWHHRPGTSKPRGFIEGYRSGLEEKVAQELKDLGLTVGYEDTVIEYTQPSKPRKYTPDFHLPNGIFIETKGRLVTADRQKHLMVKAQHPGLDLRFVFSNSRQRINKGSPTTYADWCDKHGFRYADKSVPKEWIHEHSRN